MGNGARNLRPYLDGDNSIDRAGRFHDLANVSAIRLARKVLRPFLPFELKGSKDSDCDNRSCCNQPVTLEHSHPNSLSFRTDQFPSHSQSSRWRAQGRSCANAAFICAGAGTFSISNLMDADYLSVRGHYT